MKMIFKLVFIFLAVPFLSLASCPGGTGASPVLFPARETIAGDSTRLEKERMERIRRAEAREIERDDPRREALVRWSWTITEMLERRNRLTLTSPRLSGFTLRADLTRWLTLTPDLSAEWRVNSRWGLLAGGRWTSWGWKDKERRYALWEVTVGGRYYLGPAARWHAGVFFRAGEFNHKLGKTGKQGSYLGGGVAGGYRLPLGERLSLDFNLGVGYTRVDQEKYILVNKVRVRGPGVKKNRVGVSGAGIALEFRI